MKDETNVEIDKATLKIGENIYVGIGPSGLQTFDFEKSKLQAAEDAAARGDLIGALNNLRQLGLEYFAKFLWSGPHADYPALSKILPKIPDMELQRKWNGAGGVRNLLNTLESIRTITSVFAEKSDVTLSEANILDYGCGWGRFLRALLYWSDPDRLHGCDPWEQSVLACNEHQVLGDIRQSDYLPSALPFGEKTFDFVMAFSVFTHTSERSSIASLQAIRASMKPNGLLMATIRPIEFLSNMKVAKPELTRIKQSFVKQGFGFYAHKGRPKVDGDSTYGETIISLEKFESLVPGWQIVALERTIRDPFQIMVFLKAV